MDWDYWLGRKYDLLGQNAAADTTRAQAGLISANAGANLDTVRAGLLPGQTEADIAESKARANLTNVNASLAPGLAKASEASSYGGAKANIAQAGLYGAQTTGENQANDSLGKLGLTSNPIIQQLIKRLGGYGGLTPAQ
jgi:hypothetical protein